MDGEENDRSGDGMIGVEGVGATTSHDDDDDDARHLGCVCCCCCCSPVAAFVGFFDGS